LPQLIGAPCNGQPFSLNTWPWQDHLASGLMVGTITATLPACGARTIGVGWCHDSEPEQIITSA